MYEPYGEENKGLNLKEKFNQIKQKIQEKLGSSSLKNIKLNKVTITAVALGFLLVTGTISGYIAYTGKINTLQSDNLIKTKEIDSLKTELDDSAGKLTKCSSDLQTTESTLEETKGELSKITLSYESTKNNLGICNEDKLGLASDIQLANEDLKKKESEYNSLKDSYNSLKSDIDNLACNYAKSACGSAGMNYYYLDNNEKVVCCLNEDTCVKTPSSDEKIKNINC